MPGDSSLFDIPPPKFGRFRVQHQIGVGATGPVFLAEDPETHSSVVVKVLRTSLPPDVKQLVVDDLIGIIARSPSHPSLVPARAAGLEQDEPYFVSDLARGEPLDAALERYGPGAIVDLLPRVRAIAEALDEAAEHGFVHGALHPRDVIVSEDSTFVTGVGVAEILRRRGTTIPIRRPYTAPEIGRGEPPTAATDQFSLAALSFEWLFGEQIAGPAYAPLVVPEFPGVKLGELCDAFTTALASDPSARFKNCRAFVAAIEAAVPSTIAAPIGDRLADVRLRTEHELTPAWEQAESMDARFGRAERHEPNLNLAPSFSSGSMFATQNERRGFGLGALAATLLLGLSVGLGGGYVASTRLWPATITSPGPAPASRRPLPPIEEMRSAAAAPAAPRETMPATEVPVAPVTPAPAPEPKGPRPTIGQPPIIAPVQSASVEPGGLVVDSRPPGAAVTINGVPRGRTPLTIDRVTPGDYIVTMRLTNFRPVTVAVHVTAGERARAAASLELVRD